MNIQTNEEVKKLYQLIEEGKISQAKENLVNLFEYDIGNEELKFAHWCCSYWEKTVNAVSRRGAYEQGETLVNFWKNFSTDLEDQKNISRKVLFALQKGIFTIAFNAYKSVLFDKSSLDLTAQQKAEINCRISICCKKLGKYEEALSTLAEAHSANPSSAEILAEIADSFALCGEDKKAKVLFREAFFIDAQRIDIEFLESELICSLISQVKEMGCTGSALKEWIPVYGVIFGVFNIKRELKSHEATKLKQEIFAKENELKNPVNDSRILIPKLINMYFWLIDHYVRSEESSKKINECLLQIRVHNENIYRLYTKGSSKR